MILNGFTLPNIDKGYKTTIEMDFYTFKVSNGTVSHLDAGKQYDKYICDCSIVLNKTDYDVFINLVKSADILTLQTNNEFYPFGYGIQEPTGGFNVVVSEINDKGMIDDLGKAFRVSFKIHWNYQNVIWNIPPVEYCKMGNLDIMGLSNIRYGRFDPKIDYPISVQHTKGGNIDTIKYATDKFKNESTFVLTLRNDILHNLLYRIINSYRNSVFYIKGGDNYYIFSKQGLDNTQYSVKLASGKIELTNKEFESTDIKFDIVREIN